MLAVIKITLKIIIINYKKYFFVKLLKTASHSKESLDYLFLKIYNKQMKKFKNDYFKIFYLFTK